MVQHFSAGYVFDPEDPRAPTHQQWSAMNQAERSRIVGMLPEGVPVVTNLEEETRRREEETRRREEETRRREEAERMLAEARAEIARLTKT